MRRNRRSVGFFDQEMGRSGSSEPAHLALALDMIYVKDGHGDPPILEIYQDMLADALDERAEREADILMTALSVQSAVGSLSEAIKAALDPNGPGGASITASEAQSILEILDRLEDHTDEIEDVVDIR